MSRSIRELIRPLTPGERRRRDRESVLDDIEPYREIQPEETGSFVESVLRTASEMMRSRPELLASAAEAETLRERACWHALVERERRRR